MSELDFGTAPVKNMERVSHAFSHYNHAMDNIGLEASIRLGKMGSLFTGIVDKLNSLVFDNKKLIKLTTNVGNYNTRKALDAYRDYHKLGNKSISVSLPLGATAEHAPTLPGRIVSKLANGQRGVVQMLSESLELTIRNLQQGLNNPELLSEKLLVVKLPDIKIVEELQSTIKNYRENEVDEVITLELTDIFPTVESFQNYIESLTRLSKFLESLAKVNLGLKAERLSRLVVTLSGELEQGQGLAALNGKSLAEVISVMAKWIEMLGIISYLAEAHLTFAARVLDELEKI